MKYFCHCALHLQNNQLPLMMQLPPAGLRVEVRQSLILQIGMMRGVAKTMLLTVQLSKGALNRKVASNL